ncbi:MAG: hypothetical protein HYX48_03545 [Chlamydiales bacterium]|nr:hypothetical protein [Chlamydiales bacterium]
MREESSFWRFFDVRKSLFFKCSLIAFTLSSWHTSIANAEDEIALLADLNLSKSDDAGGSYTINFNNVSIIEYIRYVSKITGLNFVFDDQELQFNVTIVSEEPITTKNILSAMIQVLRIHGLTLLEQENNLLITKSTTVNQIPTIVSPDLPEKHGRAPIVTRIFRIKNVSPDSIANLIRPMVSASALIEVSKETRQLIVTDIVTNIEKISSLLVSLDSPHSPLEIEAYVAKHISPIELIALATQIVTPFAEGNPLLFVPQLDTNSIFIISTPYLIERAMAVMEDLDIASKATPIKGNGKATFYVYQIEHASEEQLSTALKQMIENIQDSSTPDENLIEALKSMRWIKENNSLIFTGDAKSIEQIKILLPTFDVVPAKSKRALSTGTDFLMYRPKNRTGTGLVEGMEEVSDKLKDSGLADPSLLYSIEKMQWVPETNTLLFTGDPETLKKVQEILIELDNSSGVAVEEGREFYLYKLQYVQGNELLKNLEMLASDLPSDDPVSENLAKTIDKIKWVKDNNSLLITGSTISVEKVKSLIAQFDTAEAAGAALAGGKSSFFIYKPKYQSAEFIQESLTTISTDLEQSGLIDRGLLQTLKTMRPVPATNSLLFTGSPESIQKVQGLLATIDVSIGEAHVIQRIGNMTFIIYKLTAASAPEFMSSMRSVSAQLDKSNAVDKELSQAINSMKWIKETNSILFTGSQQALERVEALAEKFDIAALGGTKAAPMSYVLYTPVYQNGPDLIQILCLFEKNLTDSGVSDPALFDTINNLKWMDQTSSLVITGDADSIKKVEALLVKFDIPSKAEEGAVPSISSIENTSFLVYKLQYHQGTDIITAIKQVASELSKSTATPTQNLVAAINSLQWINVTNSLIATGDQDVLTKLKDLVQSLDVPLKQVFIEVLIIETSLSNLQSFGVQWGGFAKYRDKVGIGYGNFPATNPFSGQSAASPVFQSGLQAVNATSFPNPNTQIPFTQGFDLGSIGDIVMHKGRSFISLGALVNALQTDIDSTIVLNPKLICQDTTNSTIFVGQNIPYTGSVLNVSGGINTSVTSNIEYRDIGMNLSITPYLGNSDIITLEISNDLSTQISASANQNIPPNGILTTHTSLNTRVHVPDKHFVVLSGMIQDTKQHFKSGIPCLGGLPVIGAAFSENDRTNSKDNLIIFIRPQIINNYEEYKNVTGHQEQLYKDEIVLPVMKEEFDEGINLVKQSDNE